MLGLHLAHCGRRSLGWGRGGALAFAIALASTVPSGAGAQPTAAVADRAFALGEAGLVAYEADRIDAAITLFEEAYAAVPKAVFLYNIGAICEEKGRPLAALDVYRRYLAHDGELAARSEVEERRAAIEKAWPEIALITSPEGAEGRIVGDETLVEIVTPWRGRLAAGRYTVTLSKSGHDERREAFEAGSGTELNYVLAPRSAAGTMRLHLSAPELSVAIGGEVPRPGPVDFRVVLPPGRHHVSVTDADGPRAQTEVDLCDGCMATVEVLTVEARPNEASPRWVRWTLLGAGGAAWALSGVALALSGSAYDEADDMTRCFRSGPEDCPDRPSMAEIEQKNTDGDTWGTVSITAFGVGTVAVATGAYLWLSADGETEAAIAVVPGGLLGRTRF